MTMPEADRRTMSDTAYVVREAPVCGLSPCREPAVMIHTVWIETTWMYQVALCKGHNEYRIYMRSQFVEVREN